MVIAAILAASVSLANLTAGKEGEPSLWETWFAKTTRPLIESLARARNWVFGSASIFKSKRALAEENARLKAMVDRIGWLEAQIEALQKENYRLQDLLEFRKSLPGEYKAARVIGRNPGRWFSSVTIDIGTAEGVHVDDPVISNAGLVGRILSCEEHTSVVLLLTDPESGVGVVTNRSRDYGVVVGGKGDGTLVLKLFSKNADVLAGDKLMSSGLNSKFPAGFLVGEITDVYIPGPGLIKEALVRPAADFEHLEEVLVKTK